MLLGNRVIKRVLLAVWWSTMPHIGKCAPTSGQNDISIAKDYDIHVPLSAIPLGVNVGPSLEILSFRSDEKTGELPWIARRGWLAVGDVLVSLEGENMSEFNPGDFAEAVQKVVESKRSNTQPLAVPTKTQHQESDATEHITFRVRPGAQVGRSKRAHGMYSPPTQEEAEEEHARWHLTYSTGPLSAEKANVTVSAFGTDPGGCDTLPVVVASPEDGCSPLLNVQQVSGAHVLVRRGGCSFLAKALRISNSGGRSLVVIDDGAGRLKMEAEQRQTVDIPVVMVSKLEGESLKKMATSTSRATGKVAATLVTAAACLSQTVPPQHQPRPQRPPPIDGVNPPPIGADRVSEGSGSDGAVPTAGSGRRVEASIDSVENEDLALSTRATLDEGVRAEISEDAAVVAGAGTTRRGSGGEGVVPCRQRSSGPLRGGHLILRARGGPEYSVEFVSTLVSGPLRSVDRQDGESRREGKNADNNEAFLVAVLDGGCKLPTREEQAQSAAKGSVLLLPPDPACSVANQMRAGGKLGAEVLVVIAGATNENLASVASSTTTSIFTGNFPNSEPQPTILVDKSVHITTGPRENGPNSEQTRKSRKTAGGRGARGGDPAGRVLGSEARRTINGGPSATTVPEAPATGDACPPLTVVVGHEEGKRMVEWFRGVRSAVEGGSMGGDDGGGVVTASLAERENVGRLWGDVLWASDPRNWPAGAKQRRRILNRLRKTHSTDHAGRGSRTASATRWSLLERAYAALDGATGGASQRPQATTGKDGPRSMDAAATAGAETEL